jgi:predicted enzyme related to lactoylglutathione lyase
MSSASPPGPTYRRIHPFKKEHPVPKRDSALLGAPCWVDLFTSDPEKAHAFYCQLFGWTAENAGDEYGGYINFSTDGLAVAGCMKNDGQSGAPDLWSVYLASDDAKATVDAAAAHGGQVLVPAMDVMELGRMAVLTDIGQASICAWQPGTHKGFGILGEPGTPNWFELHTRDYNASVQFYRDVFEWDVHVASDTPEFRYSTLGEGETALAGIMDATAFLPERVPANWQIYFGVDDTDAALAKIIDPGGSVITAAEDTPFGRLASAADPTGARFKLTAG